MRITEGGLRNIIRQILIEQDDKTPVAAPDTATIRLTNTGDRGCFLAGVYFEGDTDQQDNLLTAGAGVLIKQGASFLATYRTVTDRFAGKKLTTYRAVVESKPSGATSKYERQSVQGMVIFSSSATETVVMLPTRATEPSDGEDGDANSFTAAEIAALPREAGEFLEEMEDPTDPEFSYAIFYKKVPTRVVVTRAPLGDTKGGKAVQTSGRELNAQKYTAGFKAISGAFNSEMSELAPAVAKTDTAAP